MKDNRSVDKVEATLDEAGYHPALVFAGKAKISGNALKYKDIIRIKKCLKEKGFNLLSLSETTWKDN